MENQPDGRPLRSTASQETLVSMMQVEPSPMDTPKDDFDMDLPKSPGELASATVSDSVGLSSTGRGPVFYLLRIQKYSSYTFSVFTAVHLATTSLVPLVTRSVPASESNLLLAREIYQTPLTEPIFVAIPILAHVGAGMAIRLLRRAHNIKRYGGATSAVFALPRDKTSSSSPTSKTVSVWPRVSYISISGYAFTAVMAAHTIMNRGLPLALEGDSSSIGLSYVSHGFSRHPGVSWVAFTGLLAVGCGHIVWGWARWMGIAQLAGWRVKRPTGNVSVDRVVRKRRRRRFLAINGAAIAAMLLWAAGGLGVVARGGEVSGWTGKVYDGLFASIPGL